MCRFCKKKSRTLKYRKGYRQSALMSSRHIYTMKCSPSGRTGAIRIAKACLSANFFSCSKNISRAPFPTEIVIDRIGTCELDLSVMGFSHADTRPQSNDARMIAVFCLVLLWTGLTNFVEITTQLLIESVELPVRPRLFMGYHTYRWISSIHFEIVVITERKSD